MATSKRRTREEAATIKAEFARLYPDWPSTVKITLAQMEEQVDQMARTKAVNELIKAM